MTKKIVKTEWNSCEVVPENGASIIVKIDGTNSEYSAIVDYADGEVWVIYDGDGGVNVRMCDVVGQWKLKPSDTVSNETKPAATEPDRIKSKRFSLNISDEDLHRYISDGLKADNGATVENMWTNADGGFIVYGYGLGKVKP